MDVGYYVDFMNPDWEQINMDMANYEDKLITLRPTTKGTSESRVSTETSTSSADSDVTSHFTKVVTSSSASAIDWTLIVFVTIFLIGFVANAYALITWRKLRTDITWYIQVLSITNGSFLIITLAIVGLRNWKEKSMKMICLFQHLAYLVNNFFTMFSVTMMVGWCFFSWNLNKKWKLRLTLALIAVCLLMCLLVVLLQLLHLDLGRFAAEMSASLATFTICFLVFMVSLFLKTFKLSGGKERQVHEVQDIANSVERTRSDNKFAGVVAVYGAWAFLTFLVFNALLIASAIAVQNKWPICIPNEQWLMLVSSANATTNPFFSISVYQQAKYKEKRCTRVELTA